MNWSCCMMMQVDAHDVQVMDDSMGRIVKQCTSEEKNYK